ncbi:Zinc finger, PHD-type [Corchorus olitorius]|uniref:Zinc finger, PHD-type n=1 Tax=Corchorus olitorius TaxID=93759 RepID=A0A1R3IPT8_9ROSI|nr:Zinc finger, PHD-type [Corchorus olitorius]
MENCQQVESTTALYKPCLQDNDGGCDGGDVVGCNNSDSLNRDSLRGVEFMNVDQCQKIPDMDDSQLVGSADVAVRAGTGITAVTQVGNGVKVVEQNPVKRRRGRPPKNQGRTTSSAPLPPPSQRNNQDEEDVCFICFDGGSLVLCDRRGCPKAYHPACIKRDEAFFKSKAKWNCDELTKAKNPWKETAIMGPRGESSGELNNNGINAKGANMEMSGQDLGASNSKRRKTMRQQKVLNQIEPVEAEKPGVIKGMSLPEGRNWASNELLEFVSHVKNGDISELSRFDVQALLLEYISRSNLRDPHQKSYVVCDSMLIKLFGKRRLGHFEMLKLLESHFLIEDQSKVIDIIRGGGTETSATQLAFDGNSDSQPIIANDKRRKTRKKVDEKGQKANPEEFAAIDVHNMNMIYLKRNLMENLIDDADKFNDKVVGSFVRVKVSGSSDQKQDMHRLVQVVGTVKVAEPYKIGEKTTNVMLEISNLDKREVVSIDGISNQEFSEDECKQLDQNIKCGLFKWFTVDEIRKKAMALQAVRVNDWLESEILRVQNLRDRAKKLQLLNSPDERQRRFNEIPEVHSDPNMNQYFKSQEVAGELHENKKGNNMKQRNSCFGMKEKEPASPLKGGDIASRENSIPPHSTGLEPSVNNVEADKWHYQDPHGRIQGPFPMALLRKWSESGHFPRELRIWREKETQDDSILLIDAIDGRYSQEQKLFPNSCLLTDGVRIASDDGSKNGDGDVRESRAMNVNQMDSKMVEGSSASMQNDTSGHLCANNESVKNKELASQSSPCTAPLDVVNSNAVQMASPLPHWDSAKGDNDFPGQPQVSSSLLPSSSLSGKPSETQSHQVSEGHGAEKWDGGSISMNDNLNQTSEGQILAGNVKQDDSEGKSDLPTSTSKLTHEDSKGQTTENKQSLSANVPHQDSGPSWSTASSLVVNGPQLAEVAAEWGGYSNTPVKPSVEEWDSDLVPESSLKPTELASDHAPTPTSGSGQLTHSSPTGPVNNASAWDPIVPEPNEYSLGDESVSDLLAEVEAMESLNGLASPTSILRCDTELAQGSEHDCFSPVEGLSPAPDPGKGDALSSTNDLQMPSQSTVTTEPFPVSQSEVLDAQKSSGGHSSTSAEMDEDKRPSDVSVNQYEAGPDIQPPPPPVTTWGMTTVDTAWRAEPETTAPNWGAVQGNANYNWGGADHRGIGRHHTVVRMESVLSELRPKGSEFVNFMKAGTARRELHVVIGTLESE